VTDAVPPRVFAGSPTDDESAAIAALFAELLVARAAAAEPLQEERARSEWERTMRPLRVQADGVDRRWNDHPGA
jgi:hypothetical protein